MYGTLHFSHLNSIISITNSKGGMGDTGRSCETIIAQLLAVLKPRYDYILIDCGLKQELLIDKLRPFFTADIGFHPYPKDRLEAFSQQLDQEGQFERIIVRRIPGTDEYEILAGHNRTEAGKLAGWTNMAAEIVDADDDRAITIAISTNLLRRQGLTILERGNAYKALLEAQRKQGFRSDLQTSGDNRQRFLAREMVAAFFGVTEYEIRKAIKLTQLIPPLANLVENDPKKLNLACADLIADYDPQSQEA